MTSIIEPAREIPVRYDVDIVIAGGGAAGVAAAVCAARLNLSVVMIESTTIPGGMVTHVTSWLNDFDNKGGFAKEFLSYIELNALYQCPNYNLFLTLPYFEKLLRESGVRPLYMTHVVAAIVENDVVRGVIVESKAGRYALRAKCVIDATGDGDVAASAGARFNIGRRKDGACQAISLSQMFTNYTRDQSDPDTIARLAIEAGQKLGIKYRLPYEKWCPKQIVGTVGTISVGLPHVTGYDIFTPEGLSDALIELRRQAFDIYTVLKQGTDRFSEWEFGPPAAIPGIRESRRITGDVTITKQDVLEGGRYDDGLFLVAQNIDIHQCAEGEPSITVTKVKPYHLPYRALLPKDITGLLLIGRCISGEHEALASYRIIADCFGMGEAAAIAASMAIKNNCSLRGIGITQLQSEMRNRGYLQ